VTYQLALVLYGLSEIIFPYKQYISVDMNLMSGTDKMWQIKKILYWKNNWSRYFRKIFVL
jgi:hypothetical protein